MLKDKSQAELDLEIKVALLGQRQDHIESRIKIMDQRLGRMEESINDLNANIAKWGGAIAVLTSGSSFLASGLL